MDKNHRYVGKELTLFSEAKNWTGYLGRLLGPSLRGHVLEVGAGIGSNTKVLNTFEHSTWARLEHDSQLADKIRNANQDLLASGDLSVVTGKTSDLDESCKYDTILYIDVLEHISDDARELSRATSHLNTSGLLVVLAPAFPFPYSVFDEEIGHYRRYDKAKLLSISPNHCSVSNAFYVDSLGVLASLGNRLLLKQKSPSLRPIHIWDRFLVLLSKTMDRVCRYKSGKSVVVIWRKDSELR